MAVHTRADARVCGDEVVMHLTKSRRGTKKSFPPGEHQLRHGGFLHPIG